MARQRKARLEGTVSISKVELFKRIHKRTKLPMPMLSASYEALREEIMLVLDEGNSVSLRGFGTFTVKLGGSKFDITKVAPHTEGDGDSSTIESVIQPMKYMKFVPARVAQARLRSTDY